MTAQTSGQATVLLLGPVGVGFGEQFLAPQSAMSRALLAALALDAGQAVPDYALLNLVWGNRAPDSRSAVAVAVHRLRQWLRDHIGESATVNRTSGGYALSLTGSTDVEQFRALVRAASKMSASDAATTFEEALAYWRGPALADLPSNVLVDVAARLNQEGQAATLEYCRSLLHVGQARKAVGLLEPLASDNPLEEPIWAALLEALAASGRQAQAIEVYEQIRSSLAESLGMDPGNELQQVYLRVLRQEIPTQPGPGPIVHIGSPVPSQLPGDVVTFTGRTWHLSELDAMLADPDPTAAIICAISGTAGVGKTALAVHWARRVADRFPDGQLYMNLRGFDPSWPVEPAEALRGFLEALGVSPQGIPTGLDAQAGLYRSLLAGKRSLVVLDNARDADQVRPLLPGSPGCLALVTSRNQLSGLIAAEGARPLRLDLLPAADARRLLSRRLGAERVAAEPQAADEIISRCARLPLALVVAAARAATNPQFRLEDVASQLMEVRDQLDAFGGDDPVTDIRAVFSWSYQKLSGEAARVFRLLGLHPGPDVAIHAVASLAGVDAAQALRLLAELTRSHLVTEHTPGRYAFHDLLRAYAVERNHLVDPDAERYAALQRMLDHYLHTAHAAATLLSPHRDPIEPVPAESGVSIDGPTDYQRSFAWFAAECPALLAAVDLAAGTGFDIHAWQLAWALSPFLDRRGHWLDWAVAQRTALSATQRLDDRAGEARVHRQLGLANARLGRDGDAQTHYRHAVDLFANLGDHSNQAGTHLDLGWMRARQSNHEQALDHARQALELYQSAGNRYGQANALNGIGWSYAELGDHRQAIAHCERAVALHREIGNRRGEAITLDSLGYAHHNLGHYQQAAECYQRALEMVHDLDESYSPALILTHLGDAHNAAGADEPAREAWRQALDLLEKLDHPDADAVRTKLDSLAEPAQQRPSDPAHR